MIKQEYDAVVVGAGPAGSIAAKTMAEGGLSVLVLEKKQEIGTPKRCAEGINILGLQEVGVELDEKWAVNEVGSSSIFAPSGKEVRIKDLGTRGFILERKIFEKHLAEKAIDAGARYMVKTIAKDLIIEEGKVCGVKAKFMDKEYSIKSKVVVACDGVESLMAKKAGLDAVNKMTHYHSGFQYEMCGVKTNPDSLSLYFGNDVAPKGYVWIFPKCGSTANVGVGIRGDLSEDGGRARDYLDRFIESHPKIFKDASPIEVNSGGIPVNQDMETFVADGFMAAGDAAQQVNPIHGGGIALAMNAGKIAGETAVEAVDAGDFSRDFLIKYENKWRSTEGKRLKKLLNLRLFLEKLEDRDFELFADSLTGGDLLDFTACDFKSLMKIVVKNPRLLSLSKKLIS